jgi:hypothetical protein
MNTTTIKKSALFLAFAAFGAILPLNVAGGDQNRLLAEVECFDCQQCEGICCADCGSGTQENKCTMGEPWCPSNCET